MNSNNTDIDLTMPYIITSVVFWLYEDLLSITWTPTRYYDFLTSVSTSILAAQNRNPYIVLNSLQLIKKYMERMNEEKLVLESEYCIFVAAFRIGQKFNDDFYCNQFEIDASMLTEMSSLQLKQFEFRLLDKINYKISMALDEYLDWKDLCQNIYVTSITPTIIYNDVNYNHANSYMYVLNSSFDPYCLYTSNGGMLSPPSSVISKNDFGCSDEGTLFLNPTIDFDCGFEMNY